MLVVLCGLPASGKTTLARGLCERLADCGHAFDVLHSDDVASSTYERLYERVRDADGDWILDGTFYRRIHRERFRRLDDRCFVAWVRASPETCLARNREREAPISERGVHAMAAEFEPPREDLAIDTEALSEREALERLETAVLGWLSDAAVDADGA